MKKSMLALAAFGALCLAACSSSKTNEAYVSDLNGKWNVVEIYGEPVNVPQDAPAPFFDFVTAEGRLTGNTGCNNLIGSFEPVSRAGEIHFTDLGSTRMMCPDMVTETRLLEALPNVTGFKLTDPTTCDLTDAAGATLITLARPASAE